MAVFAKIAKQPRAPGRTLVLDLWVFADDWESKPKEPICVGLRLMSDTDKSTARSDAEKSAEELHPRGGPNWVDAFNDALMRQVAALGICDPNDVQKPSPTFRMAQEQVSYALTSRGARHIFDAINRYEIESGASEPPANAEECRRIAELLGRVNVGTLPIGLRRMLYHVLEELERRAEPDERVA